MLKAEFDFKDLNARLDKITKAAEENTRVAAQAGAQVLYDEVKTRVAGLGKKTGNLDRSIYQVYSESLSNDSKSTYQVSWNTKKAPHGHLVEFGHYQRFKSYVGSDGNWYTAIRKGKQGTAKPAKRASLEAKMAYYVPLSGGPRQVVPQSFIRAAWDAKQGEAQSVVISTMLSKVREAIS